MSLSSNSIQLIYLLLIVLSLSGIIIASTINSSDLVQNQAPSSFKVEFVTTKGIAVAKVVRAWAPNGVDRFWQLLMDSYYSDNGLFRVILTPRPFVVQWGIAATPELSDKWSVEIPNDQVTQSNTRGFISYAARTDSQGKACCRTTQIYVNFGNNSRLDAMGFSPFAFVEMGMENLDNLYGGYGEQVSQDRLYKEGNSYLKTNFPSLDYLIKATVVSDSIVP